LADLVYITPYYPPFGAGGAERTCELHAKILAQNGQSVIVITPGYGDKLFENKFGVKIHRFPLIRSIGNGLQVDNKIFKSFSFLFSFTNYILKVARTSNVKCIHAQAFHIVIPSFIASLILSVPLVVHVRDTGYVCSLGAWCLLKKENNSLPNKCSLTHRFSTIRSALVIQNTAKYKIIWFFDLVKYWKNTLFQEIEQLIRRFIIRRADRIVFASKGLQNVYSSLSTFKDKSKQRVVYAPLIQDDRVNYNQMLGLLPKRVRQIKKSGGKIILYVGKISKGKGCDTLFSAHKRLMYSLDNTYLVVAGNVQGNWEYDQKNTIMLGFVNREKLDALYHYCDIVVVPSTWPEPLGWATIEAGFFSKPVVATRVGGIPEAVKNNVTGLLVERLNPEKMAEAIEKIILNRELGKRMGRKAKKYTSLKFGEEAVKQQLNRLYNGLL